MVSPKGDATLWDSEAIRKLPQAARGLGVNGVAARRISRLRRREISVLEDSKPLLPGGFSSYVWFQDDVWGTRVGWRLPPAVRCGA